LGVVAEINADSPDFDHLAPMVDAAQQDLAEHKEASQAAPGLALGPQLLFQPASSTVGVSVSGIRAWRRGCPDRRGTSSAILLG
jgi:hypothetical protein